MKSAVNSSVSLLVIFTLLLSNLLSNKNISSLICALKGFFYLFPKKAHSTFFHLCFSLFCRTPSLSLRPPDRLYTRTQWGSQSACYSLISDTIQLLILDPASRCRNQCCHMAQLPGWASGAMNRCWVGSSTAIVTNRHTAAIWTIAKRDFPSYKKYCQNKSCQLELHVVLRLHRK